MLRNKFMQIFNKVQNTSSSHQKNREVLHKLYNETPFEDFEIEFMRTIEILFTQDIIHKNPFVNRALEFTANFIASLALEDDQPRNGENDDESNQSTTHPFAKAIFINVLQYHNFDSMSARFRACQFIDLILKNAGDDAHIDDQIWDAILESLLQRIEDAKPVVRLQAIKGLARLQSPGNSECPVIHAFLARMHDCSVLVRKAILELIAPTPLTMPRIIERVRDADHNVRLTAYQKCSAVGPKIIKIVDRQVVALSGFNEEHDAVKQCFLKVLLPKWLKVYDGNYLKFMCALKIDGFVKDMERTEFICKNILELFFKIHHIDNIIEYLPIDENKIIPLEKLNYECAIYWSSLISYLSKDEISQGFIDDLIPDLPLFCNYIQSVAKENSKLTEGWKYLEFQYVLHHLLLIAGNYDIGDEVGRKVLKALLIDLLTNSKLESQNTNEIVAILVKMQPVFDSFTIDVCSLISDILEPTMEEVPSEHMLRKTQFQLAELRVKINISEEECSEAVNKGDYQKAAEVKQELDELRKQYEIINASILTDKIVIKTPRDESDAKCRCLNILIAVLSHPELKTLTIPLRTCRDEFVLPLSKNKDKQIAIGFYNCVVLYCTLDKKMAEESLKMLYSPIFFYHVEPGNEETKPILLLSIRGLVDVLLLYGTDIFPSNDERENTLQTAHMNGTRRRLYTAEDHIDDINNMDVYSVSWKDVLDILLDMLDDERADIKQLACEGICKLLIFRVAISSELIARLFLKWFNPLTPKYDAALQPMIGNSIMHLAQMDGIEDILEDAVVTVLFQLANAPGNSPLHDVDTDSALLFLSVITHHRKQFVLHKNLANKLCHKMATNTHAKYVLLYSKMLLYLELPSDDSISLEELLTQAQQILEDLVDKICKKNIEKFISKLLKLLNENKENKEVEGNVEENVDHPTANEVVSMSFLQHSVDQRLRDMAGTNEQQNNHDVDDCHNIEDVVHSSTNDLSNLSLRGNESTTLKRRKQRGRKKGLSLNSNESDTTILHTIIENSDMQLGSFADDDLTIETPPTSLDSTGSDNAKGQRRSKEAVISETSSDSDENRKRRGQPKKSISQSWDETHQKTRRRSKRKR